MLNVTPSIQNLVQLLDLLMLNDVRFRPVKETTDDMMLHEASVLNVLLLVAALAAGG